MSTKDTSLLRQQLLSQRLRLEASNLAQKSGWDARINSNLDDFLNTLSPKHKSIAFYWPIKGEPDIRPSLIRWLNAGSNRFLCLPITVKNHALKFYSWNESTEMRPGGFGIPEPMNTPEIEPDIIIAPCLGWLHEGDRIWRLGYGGGFYDRTLHSQKMAHKDPLFIGIGYELARLNSTDWSPRAHDMQLNLIITNQSNYFGKEL